MPLQVVKIWRYNKSPIFWTTCQGLLFHRSGIYEQPAGHSSLQEYYKFSWSFSSITLWPTSPYLDLYGWRKSRSTLHSRSPHHDPHGYSVYRWWEQVTTVCTSTTATAFVHRVRDLQAHFSFIGYGASIVILCRNKPLTSLKYKPSSTFLSASTPVRKAKTFDTVFCQNKQGPSSIIAGAKLSTPVPSDLNVGSWFLVFVLLFVSCLASVIPDTYRSQLLDAMTTPPAEVADLREDHPVGEPQNQTSPPVSTTTTTLQPTADGMIYGTHLFLSSTFGISHCTLGTEQCPNRKDWNHIPSLRSSWPDDSSWTWTWDPSTLEHRTHHAIGSPGFEYSISRGHRYTAANKGSGSVEVNHFQHLCFLPTVLDSSVTWATGDTHTLFPLNLLLSIWLTKLSKVWLQNSSRTVRRSPLHPQHCENPSSTWLSTWAKHIVCIELQTRFHTPCQGRRNQQLALRIWSPWSRSTEYTLLRTDAILTAFEDGWTNRSCWWCLLRSRSHLFRADRSEWWSTWKVGVVASGTKSGCVPVLIRPCLQPHVLLVLPALSLQTHSSGYGMDASTCASSVLRCCTTIWASQIKPSSWSVSAAANSNPATAAVVLDESSREKHVHRLACPQVFVTPVQHKYRISGCVHVMSWFWFITRAWMCGIVAAEKCPTAMFLPALLRISVVRASRYAPVLIYPWKFANSVRL